MKPIGWMGGACLLFAARTLLAQGEYNVLSFATDEMYNKYLLHKMYTQYERRDSILQGPLSEAQARAYGQRAKAGYLDILGEMPRRMPLNPVVTGVHDMGDFVMENVIYESSPNRHVTANLYRPKAPGKYPAVILFCGHSSSGKISVGEQRNGARYAANGIITMVVDPVSQGERNQLIDANGYQQARGGTTEHTLLLMNSLVVGESTVKDELWDNIRGLDYLASRPEVDAERLGCFGFSGGGTQSTYCLAFDDRIKVAGVGGFFTQRRRSIEVLGGADGCQHLPGEGAKELEEVDFLATFAPKPLVIVGGNYCFVDRIGAEKGYKELQHVYDAYGAKDRVYQYLGDDGHAYPKDKQDVVLNWFVKYLCGRDGKAVEAPDFAPVPTADMVCTKRGNLSEYFPNEVLIPVRNRQIWEACAPVRAKFAARPVKEQREIVRTATGVRFDASVRAEKRGEIARSGYKIEKVILHADGETPLPCLVFVPDNLSAQSKTIVFTHDRGKANFAKGADKPEILCGGGNVVVLADLRGLGETTDKPARNDPKYYNSEYTNGITAMHIGESLVAQRTRDYLMLLDYLASEPRFRGLKGVTVEAYGKCAVPALHAAMLDDRITGLDLWTDVPSWKVLLDNPTMRDQLSHIVPGAGKAYDLPDLAAALQKRKVNVNINQ